MSGEEKTQGSGQNVQKTEGNTREFINKVIKASPTGLESVNSYGPF